MCHAQRILIIMGYLEISETQVFSSSWICFTNITCYVFDCISYRPVAILSQVVAQALVGSSIYFRLLVQGWLIPRKTEKAPAICLR